MTAKSANGWATLTPGSTLLRPWVVGTKTFTGHSGPAGFVLAHVAQWFHEEIERLTGHDNPDDDHWYGVRDIGGTGIPSNHQSATAIDLNAARHPQGTPVLATFTPLQAKRITTRLHDKYLDTIVWGGTWPSNPQSTAKTDSMHFELADLSDATKADITRLAIRLVPTPMGKRLIEAQEKPVHWEKWAA